MYSPTVFASLVVLLHLPNAASAADVDALVGERILIHCKITGTYVLPDWQKGTTTSIANQGFSLIHPEYTARFSYDSDQRTLIVDPVQLSDTGNYTCSHNGGTNSPQTTTVDIKEGEGQCPTEKATCACFVVAIVALTVVIIICCYILIRAYKDKQDDKQKRIKVVVILIFAVVHFIVVSAWFIAMQATVEDCEKITEEDHKILIGLLVVEIISILLSVTAIILLCKCCGSTNESNPDDPRNLDHLNYSTSTKKVQELNQQVGKMLDSTSESPGSYTGYEMLVLRQDDLLHIAHDSSNPNTGSTQEVGSREGLLNVKGTCILIDYK